MSWTALLIVGITSHIMASGITDKQSCLNYAEAVAQTSAMLDKGTSNMVPVNPGYGFSIVCVPNFSYHFGEAGGK